MVIKKCEKCELNYVKAGQKYCHVCQKLLNNKTKKIERAELCPSCGKRIAAKGKELCSICFFDMLDTIEKMEDENGDSIDQDIMPADMEMSAIETDQEEAAMPKDIKSEIKEDEFKDLEDEDEG